MTDKQTIAVVSAFPPGRQSLNEYGYHLVREFLARPDIARVIVLADKLDDDIPELDMGDKLEVRRIWRFNDIKTMPVILQSLRKLQPDGVIFNVQTASFGDREIPSALGLMTPMLARWFGITTGIIAHNIIAGIDLEKTILKGQRIRQAIVRLGGGLVSRSMASASYVTVTLPSYAEYLLLHYPRADISHVPHGTFDTKEGELLPLAERPKRIVTMGKFGTYKRLETLLASFDLLRDDPRFADYELVIGGTDHPNTPGYVENLARSCAADRAVRFHGYVAEEEVPEFFAQAQLSVFDYDATTGSSGVLHQTASYGAVPVFPRIGDFVDVCEAEGLRGYHYTPGSPHEMALAMREVLSDLHAAEEIGRANRSAAIEMPMADVAAFHANKIKEKQRIVGGLETLENPSPIH